jgi:hypothetical protein
MLICTATCRVFVVTVVLIISMSAPSLGTTIVAIRTPELFAIAADSAGTFKGGGNSDRERPVSKIFQSGGVLYAIGGLAKDSRRGFDPERVIADFLRASHQLQSAVTNLETILSESLREELSKLQKEEPDLFRDAIQGSINGTSVLMASFENGQPIAIGIHFVGAVNSDGKVVVRTHRLACPGDCLDGTYTFFLGHRKAIDKYVAEHDKRFSMWPEEAVRFIVQLEIDAKTPGVAPPIHVVRLNKDGIRWLSPERAVGK